MNVQKQENLLNGRNVAIFRVSLTELDDALKDFSLQVAKSAYDKALKDEPLTQQESLLLKEIDALRKGDITASDYVTRARAISNLGRAELRISVNPADAMVKLASVDALELAITPSAPNVYKVDRGEYSLSVQREGYRSSSRQITVGEINSQVTVELEKLMGTLQLQVNPADAEIAVSAVSIAAPDAEGVGSRSVRIQPTGESSLEKLPVGTYKITARKEGYESVVKEPVQIRANDIAELTLTLKPLRPSGSVIQPVIIPRPGRGTQLKAFAASMAVPGLGQHLQGHRQRGFLYEAAVIVAGAVTVWAFIRYNKALDHYEDVRTQLINEASKQYEITPGISALETKHEDAYDKAKSRRKPAIVTQVLFGVVWGINALDAGFMMPAQSSSGIVFEARPTSEGGQILVRASF